MPAWLSPHVVVSGVEAFVRSSTPDRGTVAPGAVHNRVAAATGLGRCPGFRGASAVARADLMRPPPFLQAFVDRNDRSSP